MRPREQYQKLYEIAEGQLGYFTADQARAVGIAPPRLVQFVETEDIERVSRGVYRMMHFPVSPLGQYMEATLWPQVRRPGLQAVLSHESALALYELSDVSPAKVHITLPSDIRIRRALPKYLVIHYATLPPQDVRLVEGIRATTAERTIRDVHANHLGAALLRQAIVDGRRSGHLTYAQADRLERELLASPPFGTSTHDMGAPQDMTHVVIGGGDST
jgi:predicted transcriptional regulator of viral defense system